MGFFPFLCLSTLLITMLLIDWLEAVDYHGPLVTRYLMMRGERDGRGGGEGEKEGWKLDEHGQCSHPQISLTLFLIPPFTLPLHICIPHVEKKGRYFVLQCVFVYRLDVWSHPAHFANPPAFPQSNRRVLMRLWGGVF